MTRMAPPTAAVPERVHHTLSSARSRTLRRRCLEGLMLTVATLAAAVLFAMGIDGLVVFFDTTPRIILTATVLLATAAVFAWRVLRPLITPHRLASVAQQIEAQRPELQERWSTVVELADSTDPVNVRGSDALIRQVAREADELTCTVGIQHVHDGRRLQRAAVLLSVPLCVALLAFVIAPVATNVLFRRFWAPHRIITQTQVHAVHGSRVVARGEPVTLEAELTGKPRDRATLSLRDPDGTVTAIELPRVARVTGGFSHAIRAVRDSFDYRFTAGDGRTDWLTITAEDRPTLATIHLRITPPGYSQLPTQNYDVLPRLTRALEGSRLELAMTASKPLGRLALRFGKEETAIVPPDSRGGYRYAMTLADSIVFSVELTDRFSLSNLAPPSCRIVVFPDRAPSVKITAPIDELRVAPDDTITVEFEARDDFGIESAELIVSVTKDGQTTTEARTIPLDDQADRKAITARTELNLSDYALADGDRLSYTVRVRDQRAATARADHHSQPQTPTDTERQRPPSDADSKAPHTASEPSDQPPADATESQDGTPPGNQSADFYDTAKENTPAPQETSSADGKEANHQERPTGTDSPAESDSAADPNADGSAASQPASDGKPSAASQPASAPAAANKAQSRKPQLNLPHEGSAQSMTQHLQIDEWASSFDAQQRRQIELAVDNVIARIRGLLNETSQAVDEVLTATRPDDAPWKHAYRHTINDARRQLRTVNELAARLKERTAPTPYAFVGLQVFELEKTHVEPARTNLAQAIAHQDERLTRQSHLEVASVSLHRALDILQQILEGFESEKVRQERLESHQHLEKMHEVVVEDMQDMLKVIRPWLNPREGVFRKLPEEIAEEALKRIKEAAENKRELYKLLAEVLARDPELLRKFMARMRKGALTIRDQLTVLAEEQKTQHAHTARWSTADEPGRNTLRRESWYDLVREQIELAQRTTQLYDDIETWIPKGIDKKAEPLVECRQRAQDAATRSQRIVTSLGKAPAEAFPLVEKQIGALQTLQSQIMTCDALGLRNPSLLRYISKRVEQTYELQLAQQSWRERAAAVRDRRFADFARVGQQDLLINTDVYIPKIDRLVYQLHATQGPEIGKMMEQVLDLLADQILPRQQAAELAFARDEIDVAGEAQRQTVGYFAEAESIFDEMLTAIEQAIAQEPLPMPPDKPAKTLDELLAALEQECECCEKLGALIKPNIAMPTDLMLKDGMGGGGGAGSAGRSGRGKSGTSTTSPKPGQAGDEPKKGEKGRKGQKPPGDQPPRDQGEGTGDKPSGKPSEEGKGQPGGENEQPGDNNPEETSALEKAMAEAVERRAEAEKMLREVSKALGIDPEAESAPDQPSEAAGGTGRSDRPPPREGVGRTDWKPGQSREVPDRDWTILASDLEGLLRQRRDHVPPEAYRRAIESYFKTVSDLVNAGATMPIETPPTGSDQP